MDAMEEHTGSSDRAMMIKGRRSKRPRQSSSLVNTVATSSDGGVGSGEDGRVIEINSLIPSINTSMSSDQISTSELCEDEDMANCLILLAQSGGCNDDQRQINHHENNQVKIIEKTIDQKVGMNCVYECKTCNRNFPSFQALGGHRASHKRPKQNMIDEIKKTPLIISSSSTTSSSSHDYHHQQQKNQDQDQLIITKITSQKAKIHDCSICGLEFSSGQALGGHMRRHRTTPIKVSIDDEIRPRNILQLDLNLPAPEDDDDIINDHRDLKFRFSANRKLLFSSSPALVDCHY